MVVVLVLMYYRDLDAVFGDLGSKVVEVAPGGGGLRCEAAALGR